MTDKDVFDEILDLKTRKLSSDMPATFIATVVSKGRSPGKYSENLKLELRTNDDVYTSITYPIPEALTGKGFIDLLLQSLDELDVPLKAILGKTFEWRRKALDSAMGNPRHYPVRLLTE
jgi:hypothetical protein